MCCNILQSKPYTMVPPTQISSRKDIHLEKGNIVGPQEIETGT